jgi:hypothetical protein
VPEYADLPTEVVEAMRQACLALPEVHEQQAWNGLRWCVRKHSVAHAFSIDTAEGPITMVLFRSPPGERDLLLASGHPFFTPGWGADSVGMVLDADVDWSEVAELVTESYCLLAPKKLVALVDRPSA